MKRDLLFLALLIITSLHGRAQDKEIGLYLGYGLTGITEREYIMELSDYRFRHQSPHAYIAGFNYSRQIFFPRLKFTAGINYLQRNFEYSGSARYLNIPAGAEYIFGNKLKAGIAGGLYLNTHLGHKYSSSMNTFVLGEYLKLSVGYHLKNKYRIMASWSGSTDLTNMSYFEGNGFTGSTRIWEDIGFDSIFGLTVYYTMD